MNKLPSSTVKLISSSQVIKSVWNVVKELVENSLDAGSDCIDVRLEQSGLQKIEVNDNGPGIPKEQIEHLCKPYFTSKLSSFEDLETLQTCGFRGEALHSICTIARISVITKTALDDVATLFEFDSNGSVVESKPTHHGNGTTIIVKDLFKDLPVRKQNLKSTKAQKDEVKRIEDLLMGFSLAYSNLRITLTNDKKEIWRKNRTASPSFSIREIFKSRVANALEEILIEDSEFQIHGFVPKKDCDVQVVSRSTGDRIFLSVNKRPVAISSLKKTLKENFVLSNPGVNKYPFAVLEITLDPKLIDVNLEADKTRVDIINIEKITAALSNKLQLLYDTYKPMSSEVNIETEKPESQSSGPKLPSVDIFINESQDTECQVRAILTDEAPAQQSSLQPDFVVENQQNTTPNITDEVISIVNDPVANEKWRKGNFEISPPVTLLTGPPRTPGEGTSKNNTAPEKVNTNFKSKESRKRRSSGTNDEAFTKLEKFFKSPEQRKRRYRQRKSETVEVSVKKMKESFNEKPMISKSSFKIIGNIKETSIWVVQHSKKMYALDKQRLSELMIYNKLIDKHQLAPKPLDRPIRLDQHFCRMLGRTQFDHLCGLPAEPIQTSPGRFIQHNSIKGNGFLIKKSSKQHLGQSLVQENLTDLYDDITSNDSLVCTHMTDQIPNYGIEDLIEIINNIEKDEFYRPRKVLEWIKEEARRISESNPTCSIGEFKESFQWLLNQHQQFHDVNSIHGNPLSCALKIPSDIMQ
ncbi:PMS1 protein homolog 1-like isoform X1 [Clytia hemisphaerica]|uniref:DNA mismatch repair protein S5 domain-containing protein n=1 Tax=Clytia hemisphaerica TaxID=252671 RepID=A0A7M5WZU6_9CNID